MSKDTSIKGIREEGSKKEFLEYVKGQMEYIEILTGMGLSKSESIEFMKMSALQEIKTYLCFEGEYGVYDALNDISISLGRLAECISGTQGGERFCITGDISNYNLN